MAKELLERRVEEDKKAVTVKLAVSSVKMLDAYAEWKNRDRVEVLEALIKTLLESKQFAEHFNGRSNGGK